MRKTIVSIATILVIAVLAVALVACIPSDPAKAKTNLEDSGYAVVTYTSGSLFGIGSLAMPTDCETVVVASTLKDSDALLIYYFKDSGSAKDYYDSAKAEKDKAEAEFKAEATDEEWKEYKEEMANYVFKRSGKIVYAGTKEAIKAAA